jgi:hypothetical protein
VRSGPVLSHRRWEVEEVALVLDPAIHPLAAPETATSSKAPVTRDDALRLALKLAVDAGEHERASVVPDELRRTSAGGIAAEN